MIYRRGKTFAEKYMEQESKQKRKKAPRILTAAERKKVEQLRQRVAESNKAGRIIPGAEIRC